MFRKMFTIYSSVIHVIRWRCRMLNLPVSNYLTALFNGCRSYEKKSFFFCEKQWTLFPRVRLQNPSNLLPGEQRFLPGLFFSGNGFISLARLRALRLENSLETENGRASVHPVSDVKWKHRQVRQLNRFFFSLFQTWSFWLDHVAPLHS